MSYIEEVPYIAEEPCIEGVWCIEGVVRLRGGLHGVDVPAVLEDPAAGARLIVELVESILGESWNVEVKTPGGTGAGTLVV